METQKEKKWVQIVKTLVRILVTVLTAAGTAFGVESCVALA